MKKTFAPPHLDYRNPHMEICRTGVDFGAFRKDYYVIELGPRAGIVALRDNCVLMTRQYRFLIDGDSWEIPGGRVDAGETPEKAAIRETVEETGVECAGLKKLVEYYPGLDNFNNRTTIFLSKSVRTVKPFQPMPSEVTAIEWFPVADAVDMVRTGKILDALTVAGLLALRALEN